MHIQTKHTNFIVLCSGLLLCLCGWNIAGVEAFLGVQTRQVATPHYSLPCPHPRRHGRLYQQKYDKNDPSEQGSSSSSSALILSETSNALERVSWFSWWSQVILSTVSAVILVFARNALLQFQQQQQRISSPPFFLSAAGLSLSALSILWTWAKGARLSRRLRKSSLATASNLLARAIRVGVSLNLLGLLITLIAAEQLVGGLAIKVLTTNNASMLLSSTAPGLQPLDVLLVQANTNTLLSHFCSLASSLYLTDKLEKLKE